MTMQSLPWQVLASQERTLKSLSGPVDMGLADPSKRSRNIRIIILTTHINLYIFSFLIKFIFIKLSGLPKYRAVNFLGLTGKDLYFSICHVDLIFQAGL